VRRGNSWEASESELMKMNQAHFAAVPKMCEMDSKKSGEWVSYKL